MAEAERTTAVEGLAFTVKDQASAPAEKMASAFERVHHATERAGEKIKSFAHSAALGALGAVGLGLGFREITEKVKDANLELEGAAKKIAGVHFAFGGWRSDISAAEKWTYALEEGREVVDKLDASEFKLHKTRGELANVYKSAYAIGTRHNLNQQQMLDLTEKLAASETVLGTSAEMAAMSISRAVMTGNIRGFDDFNKQLRFSVGNMKEFHKMSESARFAKIQKAMGDLVPAAVGMGGGMAGAMADIKIAVDNIVRDLTGPLFQEQSKSLREWAKNITKIREDGKSIAAEYGEKLVSAFHTLKDVTSFLLDHWEQIAVIWGSFKLASWTMNSGGAAGGLASVFGGLAPAAGAATGGLSKFAGQLGIAAGSLGILYVALEGLAKYIDGMQSEGLARHAAAPRTMTALTAGAKAMSSALHENSVETTMGHLKTAFAAYGLKPGQMLSRETLAAELKAMEPGIAAQQLGMYGIKGMSAKSVQAPGVLDEAAGRVSTLLNNFAAQLLAANPDLGKGPSPHVTKQERNTYIAHVSLTQEFKESDPDRVFHKAINEIDHMVNTPRGATTNALGA
jgi:hypothetical protein